MGVFSNIRDHFTIASGNFAALLKDVDIPQLPEAVTCLLAEFKKEDPEIQQLARIISADMEISTKILRTVNSALYGLPNPVKSIQNAIMILGLRSIETLVLSYTIRASLPKPKGKLFDQEAFWGDSLLRALLARSLARYAKVKDEDEAFTASLLSNLALPVLLCVWEKYYTPVVELWQESNLRLSEAEQQEFDWDHAQAGAWILKSWDFPDEIVGLVGSHNFSMEEIRKYGLDQTLALPVAVASLLPSILRPSLDGSQLLVDTVKAEFFMPTNRFANLLDTVSSEYNDIREQFGIQKQGADRILEDVLRICDPQYAEKT